jgi:cell wall-associated NlpC family hydrolase
MTVTDALQAVDAIQQRIAAIDPQLAPSTSVSFADQLSQAQTGSLDPRVRNAATIDGTDATALAATTDAGAVPSAGAADASPYDDLIVQAANANGVDPALLKALVRQESNFNPNAVSGAGAQGLTQLMPGTAAGLGVTSPSDPLQSLMGGARYLHNALAQFGGDESLALAAYNAGGGAVRRYGGIPPYPETQAYVPKVLAYAQQYRAEGFGQAAATGAAASGGALGVQAAATGAAPAPAAQKALAVASQYLGTPYRWGGESPATGFDCSGLVQYAYGQAGVSVPRVAADQYNVGTPVGRDQLQPGDIVFFKDSSGYVHHEGIYVGAGRFLHAPHTGDVVKVSSLADPYYAQQFAGGRRVA